MVVLASANACRSLRCTLVRSIVTRYGKVENRWRVGHLRYLGMYPELADPARTLLDVIACLGERHEIFQQ
jgi:hypothetical protein